MHTKKMEKTILIKREITELIPKLGKGECDSVPYDTAWVARIGSTCVSSVPAFPKCLEWIRNHQLENGSWGEYPYSAHSTTLNTLTALMTLSQWNYPEDKERIKKGVQALKNLAQALPLEKHEGIEFQFILPGLVQESKDIGLSIPNYLEFYTNNNPKKDQNLEILKESILNKNNAVKVPRRLSFGLEMMNDKQLVRDIADMETLTKNCSVAVSPSATAFVLSTMRKSGSDIPSYYNYLRETSEEHEGGIPHFTDADIFELAFSIDFLLKGGYSPKDQVLTVPMKKLAENLSLEKGFNFSSQWEAPDANCTAIAMHVLHSAGYTVSFEPLIKFFNGSCIHEYMNENGFSVSVNFNSLSTLCLFKEFKGVEVIKKQIILWLEETAVYQGDGANVFVEDTWHVSQYYTISRAIFAMNELPIDLVEKCLKFVVNSQHSDGGWGVSDSSTFEETAYAALSLCFAFRNDHDLDSNILKRAYEYFNSETAESYPPLWKGKVLYCPRLIVKSAVCAARLALASVVDV